MATYTANHIAGTGGTYYAYPVLRSLVDWTTYRVLLAEAASPDEGLYQGTIDDADGSEWLVYSGASQPAGEYAAVATLTTIGATANTVSSSTATTSLELSTGSTPVKSVTCEYDVSERTLEVIFETLQGRTDIATVADGSITKSTTVAEFTIPAAVTTVERTLRARIVDTDTGETMANLMVFVTYGSTGD